MYAEINGDKLITWPYDHDTLCRANPYTAFPKDKTLLEMYSGTENSLAGNTLVKVVEQPQPAFNAKTQSVSLDSQPTLTNGEWVLGWTISALTQQQQDAATQQKAAAIRNQRNQKLAECDWTQIADSQVDKNAWATYRQALRDLPTQSGFPWEVTWPDVA